MSRPAVRRLETAVWRTDESEFRSVESAPLGYIAYTYQSCMTINDGAIAYIMHIKATIHCNQSSNYLHINTDKPKSSCA